MEREPFPLRSLGIRRASGTRRSAGGGRRAARGGRETAPPPPPPAHPARPALKQKRRRNPPLPRRSGVAGREACGRDQAECCAANDGGSARQSEVRMIEQVEHLEAQLHAGLPGELEVLDDREDRVAEGRREDRIPRKAPEQSNTAR